MNDRTAIPTPPAHPDVWYGPKDLAPGSSQDFAVWMCSSSNGYRTVLWIYRTVNGQGFSAFDYVCDGQIGVPWVGDNSFVALHGTKPGKDYPDVVFLYGIDTTSTGSLVICFPLELWAKGPRTASYMQNDQTVVWVPNSVITAGLRYCFNGLFWTQGPYAACDPSNLAHCILPRTQYGPIVDAPPGGMTSPITRDRF